MKLQIYTLLILPAILLTSSACTTPQTTITTKSMDIYGSGVIQQPIIAEMQVSTNKVTGRASSNRAGSLHELKQRALADALSRSRADIIVEPIYETVRDGNRVSATVRGFPAVYVNFRPITDADIPLIEAGVLQRATTAETLHEVESSNSNTRTILSFVALLGGLVLIGVATGG